METPIFEERTAQIHRKGETPFELECNKESLAGAVSQRACVFCGSRVVLYPIADALHLVHGPIGCAASTWDIRGALSSGPELHRLSFSTDLQEVGVIFGGEAKLERALFELIDRHRPKAAFVYSTCIVGIIGDDLETVCKKVEKAKASRSSRYSPKVSRATNGRATTPPARPCSGWWAPATLAASAPKASISWVTSTCRGNLDHSGVFPAFGPGGGGQHHRRRPGG